MRVSPRTTVLNDWPQSHEILMTRTSNTSCERRDELSPALSENLSQSLEITLAQEWLACVKEGDAKDHALMILPDIISRYCQKSETVQNHQYYRDLFNLSKDQVRGALNCLEEEGILKRIWICNMMNEDEDDIGFNIMTFSDDFKKLITKQPFAKQMQGEVR